MPQASLEQVATPTAPQPVGPYSQGIASGDFVFLAGQVGIRPEDGALAEDMLGQARQTLTNVESILREAHLSLRDVCQTRVYLADIAGIKVFNDVYVEFFSSPYPARTTIGCTLPGEFLVEIDVIARRSSTPEDV